MSDNIYDYFRHQLGQSSMDLSLRGLPVVSGCGDDCKRAIDAAKAFAEIAEMADPAAKQYVISTCDEVVQIFWRG